MQNFLFVGTDCGAGKSYVICALLRDLRARGIDAMGFKPIACGDRSEARNIRQAVDLPTYRLEDINPLFFRTIAEPIMAAEIERKIIEPAAILRAYEQICSAHNLVLTELNGGWETPLATGYSTADLAAALNQAVIIVANNRPGAASLVKMLATAIQARGLNCAGVILNHIEEEWSTASVTNAGVIRELTGLPILAELIHGQDYIDSAAVLNLA